LELILEDELNEWVSRLPDISLSPPSTHLLLLAVRSRYCREIMNVKVKDMVVERKIIRPVTPWRDNYIQKVKNLAMLQRNGIYTFRDIGNIPYQGRAIYGTVIPRNVMAASADNISEAVRFMCRVGFMAEDGMQFFTRGDLNFFSALHRHRLREAFHSITLDIDDPIVYEPVKDMVSGFDLWMITKTSRGYHIILDISETGAEEFHKGGGVWDKIHTKFPTQVELQRDSQEPIPGTLYYRVSEPEVPNYVRIIE